eukprot:737708-Amorphochlora_amoeboformis.AAC.2
MPLTFLGADCTAAYTSQAMVKYERVDESGINWRRPTWGAPESSPVSVFTMATGRSCIVIKPLRMSNSTGWPVEELQSKRTVRSPGILSALVYPVLGYPSWILEMTGWPKGMQCS